jgi:hypothetical protein
MLKQELLSPLPKMSLLQFHHKSTLLEKAKNYKGWTMESEKREREFAKVAKHKG